MAALTAALIGGAVIGGAIAAKKLKDKKKRDAEAKAAAAAEQEASLAPPVTPPAEVHAEAKDVARQTKRRAVGQGRSSTILTGPGGLAPATGRQKTLLGGG